MYRTEAVLEVSKNCQFKTSGSIAELLFISDRMPFMTPTLDNADPLLAPMIAPGFYLHQVNLKKLKSLVKIEFV